MEQAITERGHNVTAVMLDEKVYNVMVVYIELGEGDAESVADEIDEMLMLKRSQWTRPKRRTKRFGFNFE